MFEPLLSFTNTNCTGHSHTLLLREKPPFVHVKGTTKKADAFGLFVYPNCFFVDPRSFFMAQKFYCRLRLMSSRAHMTAAATAPPTAMFWRNARDRRSSSLLRSSAAGVRVLAVAAANDVEP